MDHAGEAGIGKSRLTAALLERLTTELHARYFCSPQRTDSFLYPIVSQMERAAGFTHDDDTQAKLNKLDACSRRASRRLRTQYCLLTCSRCRTTYVIRRSN